MNVRILRIELRRCVAPWAGIVVLAISHPADGGRPVQRDVLAAEADRGRRRRRAVHVLLIGSVVATALLVVQAMGGDLAATAFVVRDSAGLMGLVAIGAAVCGAQYAWTLPIAWLSLSIFAPPPTNMPMQVASWMVLPPGTAAGTWTALVLAVVGTAAYAVAGPRR
ncbi:hypothetical protein [Streptomyces sp. A5-4]|uniref:hypothetical protein n=1 Tax=Streptomyces sp. A5-4 TaxID=3384771 RepID=UPI003DA82CC3